jgi:arginyl-tRNA synthetase
VDRETGESFYEDKMKPILEEGIQKGVFTEGEGGALIVAFPPEWKLPPLLLRKSDGSTLYATRDLAMVRYRLDAYAPRAVYYVVGSAQSLHFQQLFATCRLLKWDLPELEHVAFGHMRFSDAAMSTRKGTALRLEDVLDEAVRRADAVIAEHEADIQTDDRSALAEMMGVGSVVYGILSQNRKADVIFDWKKALALDGNSAPYLQYTHARARSVLRKAGMAAFVVPSDVAALSAHERSLVNTLLEYPAALSEACESRMPHVVANYLFHLAQEFNAFYNTEPILQAPEPSRALRLALTSLTADVLQSGATILTLRLPDRM